jgi:acetoin utilization deacetylase AcuC-like enzyme
VLYDDPHALFISLHRYGQGFYPGTGGVAEAGRGLGRGFNVNVPWTSDSKTDADYQARTRHATPPTHIAAHVHTPQPCSNASPGTQRPRFPMCKQDGSMMTA